MRQRLGALNPELTEQSLTFLGLPTSARDTDEDAKRFDLLILRRQQAQLHGDTLLAERLREAVQRLRRNKQLTPEDLIALEDMLITSGGAARSDIAQLSARMGGLGLFVRSLVGLERSAVEEAFADFLDGTKFTVEQVRFMTLLVDEFTANGVMEPDFYYGHDQIDLIVDILHVVKANAVATDVA